MKTLRLATVAILIAAALFAGMVRLTSPAAAYSHEEDGCSESCGANSGSNRPLTDDELDIFFYPGSYGYTSGGTATYDWKTGRWTNWRPPADYPRQNRRSWLWSGFRMIGQAVGGYPVGRRAGD